MKKISVFLLSAILSLSAPVAVFAEEAPVNEDVQYVMYLGTNDKDTNEPVFSPEEAQEVLKEILIEHFGGYTIQDAQGGWVGDDGTLYQEYSLVIYLSDTTPDQIYEAADELIETFNQSSVLIQTNSTTTEFYSGSSEEEAAPDDEAGDEAAVDEAAADEAAADEADEDVQYVLYLGTNDKDTNEPVFSPEESQEKLKDILIEHFGGYTIQDAQGGWVGDDGTLYQEYTLVVFLSDTDMEQIHAAADEMIETFNQSSVLIQTNPTQTEFYSGSAVEEEEVLDEAA